MCAPTTFFTVILRHFTVVKCSGAKDQHVSSKALNRYIYTGLYHLFLNDGFGK